VSAAAAEKKMLEYSKQLVGADAIHSPPNKKANTAAQVDGTPTIDWSQLKEKYNCDWCA
jgi:hypothetical protein